jgi:molybdopterin/thiamine biosynthesis adenylyltransferase
MSHFPPPHVPLTPHELQRYHRHLILPKVGEEGQRRSESASARLVGATGSGRRAHALAALGTAHLGMGDGSDNFPTRYPINDACVLLDKSNE